MDFDVNASSCAHVPIRDFPHWIPIVDATPAPTESPTAVAIADLQRDAVVYKPLDAAPAVHPDNAVLEPLHDWKSGSVDVSVHHLGGSGTWTEEYMDAWIYSKPGSSIHAQCALAPLATIGARVGKPLLHPPSIKMKTASAWLLLPRSPTSTSASSDGGVCAGTPSSGSGCQTFRSWMEVPPNAAAAPTVAAPCAILAALGPAAPAAMAWMGLNVPLGTAARPADSDGPVDSCADPADGAPAVARIEGPDVPRTERAPDGDGPV